MFPRQYAHFVHKVGEARRERPRFAGACSGYDAHHALGRLHGLALGGIQFFKQLAHKPRLLKSL